MDQEPEEVSGLASVLTPAAAATFLRLRVRQVVWGLLTGQIPAAPGTCGLGVDRDLLLASLRAPAEPGRARDDPRGRKL